MNGKPLLTPREFREICEHLYGFRWHSVAAKKLRRSKRTIERMASGDTAFAPDMAITLRSLIAEQMEILASCAANLGKDAGMGDAA